MSITYYSRLENKINELLGKYGAEKLLLLLSNLTETIEDDSLVLIERLIDIAAKHFSAYKRAIMISSSRQTNAVNARRAIIYVLIAECKMDEKSVQILMKMKRSTHVRQIFNYSAQCIKGQMVDEYYMKRLNLVIAEFEKVSQELREKNEKNN